MELPEIELKSCQRRLKTALLNSGYFSKKQERKFVSTTRAGIAEFRDIISNGLNSQRPVWKVASVNIVAVIVVIVTLLSVYFPGNNNRTKQGG